MKFICPVTFRAWSCEPTGAPSPWGMSCGPSSQATSPPGTHPRPRLSLPFCWPRADGEDSQAGWHPPAQAAVLEEGGRGHFRQSVFWL